MFINVLPPGGKFALELLKKISCGFYLAGGTGLALQLGHRISGDFDFFSSEEFETSVLRDKLATAGQFVLLSESEGTLHGIFKTAKVSFLKYTYPLLFPTKKLAGMEVADLRDIALMKMTAISSRGSKKDFVDLYFACQECSLDLLIELLGEKYRKVKYSKYHILKSLAFFDNADKEPDPRMLKPWVWNIIKSYFIEKAMQAMKSQ